MSHTAVVLFLKVPATAFGVTAPLFIWGAATLILAGTLACLIRLWWLVRSEGGVYHDVQTQLAVLRTTDHSARPDGLASATYQSMAQAFARCAATAPALGAAWRRFEAQLVSQRDAYWSTDSAEVAFNDMTVIEPRLNRGFFAAIPSMATGAGLLCTFLAILVSLLDVTLENEQFRGLDLLITGLSGKFLSSIAALFGATLYVFFEKRLLHRLGQHLRVLTITLDELVPRLTPTRLLLSMHQHMQAQTVAWQDFRHDLGAALQQGGNAGMGSTLQRMEQTVDNLVQWLRTAETQRAEAATGNLEGLLQQLGQSLNTSLSSMSDRFAHALSQGAHQEFESVASALNGSAQLLADMNTQFLSMQGGLSQVIALAKSSAVEQMAVGKNQVEDLTGVLREMMTQMHDTAGLSVNRMAATLTSVVHDLSTRVEEMSQRMSQTVTRSAGQNSQTTQMIIGKVDQWTTHSTQQLAQLIDKHQVHLERVQDVQHTMEGALGQFKGALSEYATVTTGMKSITMQTTTMVNATTGAMQNFKDTGEAMERVARFAASQVERLAETGLPTGRGATAPGGQSAALPTGFSRGGKRWQRPPGADRTTLAPVYGHHPARLCARDAGRGRPFCQRFPASGGLRPWAR